MSTFAFVMTPIVTAIIVGLAIAYAAYLIDRRNR